MSVATKSQPFENLTLWEHLQILVGEGNDRGLYEARVEDMLNGGIVISQPRLVDGSTLLREGVSVRVQVTRQDAVYQFSSTVRRFGSSDDGRVILTPPRSMERLQRRLFVRINVNRPGKIAVLDRTVSGRQRFDQFEFRNVSIKDISGGGLLLQLQDQLPSESPVVLHSSLFAEWDLPEYFFGRTTEPRLLTQSPHQGIEFLTISRAIRSFGPAFVATLPEIVLGYDQKAQDKLVTRVFQEQIKLRQKGLL